MDSGEDIPVAPIKVSAVNRCARSAHTRPLTKNLSNGEICASLALSAAALNRLTFSRGVSPGGPGVRGGEFFCGRFAADGGGLADAWGVVDVKRVASVADRGMAMANSSIDDTGRGGFGSGILVVLLFTFGWRYIRRFFGVR